MFWSPHTSHVLSKCLCTLPSSFLSYSHGFHFRKYPYWVWIEWLCACVGSLTRHEQLTSGYISLRNAFPYPSYCQQFLSQGVLMGPFHLCCHAHGFNCAGLRKTTSVAVSWWVPLSCHVLSRRQHFIALFPIIRFLQSLPLFLHVLWALRLGEVILNSYFISLSSATGFNYSSLQH